MNATWPHGDPHRVALSILADRHYDLAPVQRAGPTLAELIWNWLVARLRQLLHGVDQLLGPHNPFEGIVGGAVVVAAVGLVMFGAYRIVRLVVGRASVPASSSNLHAAELRGNSSTALRSAARAAAAARRFRTAAALLFSAAAHALDERGQLPFDAARTPGEYRRLVRDARFDLVARHAIVALFAASEPSADLFDRMSAAYDRFFDDA